METSWHHLTGTDRKALCTPEQVKARNVSRTDGKKWVPCDPPEKENTTPAPSVPAAPAEITMPETTAVETAKDTVMAMKKKAAKKAVKATKAAPKAKATAKTTTAKRPQGTRTKWHDLGVTDVIMHAGAINASKGKREFTPQRIMEMTKAAGLRTTLLTAGVFLNFGQRGYGQREEPLIKFTPEQNKAFNDLAAKHPLDGDARPLNQRGTRKPKAAKATAKGGKAKPKAPAKAKVSKPATKAKRTPAPVDPDEAMAAAADAAEALVGAAS